MKLSTLSLTLLFIVFCIICTCHCDAVSDLTVKVGRDTCEFNLELSQPGSIHVVLHHEEDDLAITSPAQPYDKYHEVKMDHLKPETQYRYSLVYRGVDQDMRAIKSGRFVTAHSDWSYILKD
jgi:hypothetical protein